MIDYQIQPNTRRCVISGKDLQPGERFFTALVEDGTSFQRKDYCQQSWQGPPPGTFSFWTGKVPSDLQAHKPRFDDGLLEECFHRLEGENEQSKINFRYVIALLLLRRRRFKLEQTVMEDGIEKIAVQGVSDGGRYLVINPRLTEDEMSRAQDEVFQLLGWN